MIKVGINGFGRIGRLFLRRALEEKNNFQVVVINTSGKMTAKGWVQLFKHDSVYRDYPGEVKVEGEAMVVDGQVIDLLAERNPKKIPWDKYGVELVIEATGVFRKEEEVRWHLGKTVKRVLLTAPAKEGRVPIYLIKINDEKLGEEAIWSNASCTTSCVVPVVQVIEKNFGIVKGAMTTIHAYTSDQRLLDNSHQDLRRARAAGINIVPTSTGAAKATAEVIPEVKGIFDGLALRVPVVNGSISDLTLLLKKKATKQEINKVLTDASKTPLYLGILEVSEEPLVSSDIIGKKASAIVDLNLTKVIDGDLVKLMVWYDNEWGYVCRLVETVDLVGKRLKEQGK